jgi:uncharacterized protein DUF4145
MAEKVPHIEEVHCNTCHRRTNHRRVHQHRRTGGHPREECGWWSAEYELFVCRGCDEVTLRQRERCYDDEPGEAVVTYFPPRVSRPQPAWLGRIKDENVTALLKEVYAALHADSRRLAMMGCRGVLDRMMVKAVGDVGTFEQKLARMVAQQLLSQPDRGVLAAAIDAGSASAHRGYLPTPEALDHVVSIVEHTVQATLLPSVAKEIKRTTPRRRKA